MPIISYIKGNLHVMNKIQFQETQRFNQWWVWILLIVIFGFTVQPIWETYQSGISLSSSQLWGFVILFIVILLFLTLRLETKIDEKGVWVKYFPVHWKPKFYSWDSISQMEVKKYSPLMDYGGWGIRLGRNGKAYNVKGNKGLQLFLKNGDGLLIGTQKEEEMEKFLRNIQLEKNS